MREELKARLDPLWAENPVWREISFGPGWDALLMDALDEMSGQDFSVVQLKEKFGTGRFYVNHEHGEKCGFTDTENKCSWYHPRCSVEAAITFFERGTQYLCEECGSYSIPRTENGWWRNECDSCRAGRMEPGTPSSI
jgi:hypothetical protein